LETKGKYTNRFQDFYSGSLNPAPLHFKENISLNKLDSGTSLKQHYKLMNAPKSPGKDKQIVKQKFLNYFCSPKK
jgi:hypothetical protein